MLMLGRSLLLAYAQRKAGVAVLHQLEVEHGDAQDNHCVCWLRPHSCAVLRANASAGMALPVGTGSWPCAQQLGLEVLGIVRRSLDELCFVMLEPAEAMLV